MVAQNAHRIKQLAQQYQKNIFVCFMGQQGVGLVVPTHSNTKACIPAKKHLKVKPLRCHEAVCLRSLDVAACHCERCCWSTNRLRECPCRSCQGLCATSRRDGARAGASARNKCKHVCRCAADTECLRGLMMASRPCLSDCCPPL